MKGDNVSQAFRALREAPAAGRRAS
jgi:hypothetical protein